MGTTRRIIAGLVLAVLATLPALSETIRLEQFGGVYMLPVRINDTLTIPFVLDSGAAEVVITEDIFSVLRRARTVSQSDFVGTGIYTLASGATVSSDRYVIHKMSVGDHVITDVIANVVSVKGDPLLGQTFLQKLPAWTLDNAQHALVIGDAGEQPQATPREPRSTPFTPWPTKRGAYITASSENTPPFPKSLSGFTSEAGQDFWGKPFPSRGTVRIFQGNGWQGIPDFPNTMNGCSSGVFMMRWRSGDPQTRVQSSVRYSANVSTHVQNPGTFGYMLGTNCEQPMFKFAGTTNSYRPTLLDIYYELKFWQAAP